LQKFTIPNNKLEIDFLVSKRSQNGLIPSILLGIYYLILWSPPGLFLEASFEIVIALGFLAFFIQRQKLDFSNMNLFITVTMLSFFGALISLFRSSNFSEAAWNTIAYAGNIISFMLFLPTLSTQKSRKLLIIIHILVALLWSFEIQRLVGAHGTLNYSTFQETGNNKNFIGMCISMASTACFYIAIFLKLWQKNTLINFLFKTVIGLIGFFLLFNLSLIYARSSLLSSFIGILVILYTLFNKSKKASTGVLKLLAFLIVIAGVVVVALPRIISVSTSWEQLLKPEGGKEGNTIDDRKVLLDKGLHIISQNPILGLGIGGGRHEVNDFEIGVYYETSLVHNTYLAEWVDKGILGISSLLFLLTGYYHFVKKRFSILPKIDQAWIVIMCVVFFVMLFKDLGTISMMMLAILAGIIYDQKVIEKQWRNLLIKQRKL
jgi:hypothetical protein